MIFSIVSLNDIFYTPAAANNLQRSSNPYDYIRRGYYLDNASLFGGKNYVNFNGYISGNTSGNTSGNRLGDADI